MMIKSLNIKSHEHFAVFVSFIFFFCILAAYYIIRPLRNQLAVEAGTEQLPGYFAATFVATLVLTPLFSGLVSRWPRRTIMPIFYLFCILCQSVFVFLFYNKSLLPIQTLGLLFFVWSSVFNLFIASVFWSFMTDIWDDSQARRLFPIIALGGTIGAISGPLITRSIVEFVGLASLLAISILFLAVAVACIFLLGNWAHQYGKNRFIKGNEAAIGGGMLDGLKQILTNPFIGWMSIIMVLSDAIGTIAYVLVTDYSGARFPNDPIAQTRFAATMDFAANLLQIVLQLTITRWLLIRYGAGIVFVLCAIIMVLASLGMAISQAPYAIIMGSMPAVAVVMILARGMSFGMLLPARESLYTLVPRELRYKGKNAVDTVIWRAGDVVSLVSINGFRALGVTAAGFGFIWAALAATSGFISWRLANFVERGHKSDE